MNSQLSRYEHGYLAYLQDLKHCLETRGAESDRTGTGTARLFGAQLRCDLRADFPLLTTKKVFVRGVIEELLWFLRGETNIQSLTEKGVHIWDEWATAEGELGPVYGAMWRDWPDDDDTIDQIQALVDQLKTNPGSRRMIVSAWNPALLPDTKFDPVTNAEMGRQALPPCHTMFQCFAQRMTSDERQQWLASKNRDHFEELKCVPLVAVNSFLADCEVPTHWLDLQLYQRSADWFLGVPFNAVSYSLLLMILAKHVGMAPRRFIHTFGDFHLYANHLEQAKTQLGRDVKQEVATVSLNYPDDTPLDQIKAEDIVIGNYSPADAIKAPVSV